MSNSPKEVFVGIKVKMMERHGAVRIRIFSDLRALANLDTCRVIRLGSQTISEGTLIYYQTEGVVAFCHMIPQDAPRYSCIL